MSNITRKGIAALTIVITSAVLAGGCKDDPAASSGAGGNPTTAPSAAAPGEAAPGMAGSGTAGSSASPGAGGSDPKAAAVSFARAVRDNDMAAARAVSTGTEEHYRMLESISSLFAGMKNYEAAAVAKFGEAGKSAGMPVPDMVGETEASDVTAEGDSATLINPQKPNAKDPMKLTKKDGQWKVDLASMPMNEQDKQAVAAAPKMRKVLDETAAEIKAGKYKTVQEAQQAMGMKMQAAMGPGPGSR